MYRRRLPHVYQTDLPVFLTWRLYGSLPDNRCFPKESLSSGQAFATMDRMLDQAQTGPTYLKRPDLAQMIIDSMQHHAVNLGRFQIHAFVVMWNHVHLLATPSRPIPDLMRALKSYTARRANELLNRAGPFWAEETFDRTARNQQEFGKIQVYIENNPVKAGIVSQPEDYPWSSAWKAGRCPAASRPAGFS